MFKYSKGFTVTKGEYMVDYLGDIRESIMRLCQCVEDAFKKHNKMMEDLLKSEKKLTKYTQIMIVFTSVLIAFTAIQIILRLF